MISADEGSRRAPIFLIGEAYGYWEGIYGRPFVGPSWNDKLLPWITDAKPRLTRDDLFITNTWDQGQPQKIDMIPEPEMRAAVWRLEEKIAAHEGPDGLGPRVIVPVGNYALYAVTGNGKVSWHRKDGRHDRPGIKDWRGSILSYTDRRGRTHKVIPSVHPASTFYSDVGLEWALRADWQRIATDSLFRELRLPQYTKLIAPSKAEAIEWMRWTRREAAKNRYNAKYDGRLACSLDVETPLKVEYEQRQFESKSIAPGAKCRNCGHTQRWHEADCRPKRGKKTEAQCPCSGFAGVLGKARRIKVSEEAYLGCIGYSWDVRAALCIPTTLAYWADPAVWAIVKEEIRQFHADPNVDFGGQNQPFDSWWCAEEGVPYIMAWDLLKMHRVKRPWSEAHDLAFQASIDTRHPFWKHEAKEPDQISRWSHNKEALWAYNCTDNVVQRELLPIHVAGLRASGRLEYYEQLEAPIDAELLVMSRWGIRADEPGRAGHFERVVAAAKQLGREINVGAGFDPECKHRKCGCLVKKIAVSNDRMKWFLYEKLRLPVQYTKNQKKQKVVSVDVVTIKRLMEQFPTNDELQLVGGKTLAHRRLLVEANFVKASAVDADGRCRAMFKQDTSLGRLSSSKNPKKQGRNLQNIDRKLRKYYLPDTGEETL